MRLPPVLSLLSAFASNRKGNVALIFALALMPVTLLAGGSVDLSTAMNARSRLAQALDAAALAVGTNATISTDDATAMATGFINANYPERELGTVSNIAVSVDPETNIVTVSGESQVRTTLLGLAGIPSITVHWESQVQRGGQRIELAMVLDNTGSMRGNKIAALRDSAHLLSQILYEGSARSNDVQIGLVPFAATVNVGRGFARDWWLDPNALSPIHGQWAGTDQALPVNHWTLFDSLRSTRWAGCVEARPLPMDIDDTPPSNSRPETLFVPYFAPDEPDSQQFGNNYLSDALPSGGVLARLRNLLKYDNAQPRFNGPNAACTSAPITPLTGSRSTVDSAISAMEASGTTNIGNGIAWGVRVLSPQMPFTEGSAYNDRNVIKAMVILTDGENVLSTQNTEMMSRYENYGYIADGRLGVRTASSQVMSRALDERTVAACDYAKSMGIRVYTITFQIRSAATRQMMEGCASSPSMYFNSPTTAELSDVFEMIAGDLANLRISR